MTSFLVVVSFAMGAFFGVLLLARYKALFLTKSFLRSVGIVSVAVYILVAYLIARIFVLDGVFSPFDLSLSLLACWCLPVPRVNFLVHHQSPTT